MAMRNAANTAGADTLGDSDGSSGGTSFWGLAVETWQAEGLSVSEFCRREGLNISSFYRWRRRLREQARTEDTRNAAPVRASSRQNAVQDTATNSLGYESRTEECVSSTEEQNGLSSESAFVPVQLESVAGEGGGSGAGSGVEILIDSRRVLRVERGFDHETLAAVLSVLEAGAC